MGTTLLPAKIVKVTPLEHKLFDGRKLQKWDGT